MWRNYAKIALRNLLGHKGYSFINVFGLALGMAVCMLILRYVAHERGYDRMHAQADRIYRVTHQRDLDGTLEAQATTPLALRDALLADFPEVAHAVRFLRESNPVIEHGDEQFIEEDFFYVDVDVFEVFDFELAQGDPHTALEAPDAVVITEAMARKYFGGTDPMGQTLTFRQWGQEYTFEVTGVARDVPSNSHLRFNILAPFESAQNVWDLMHGDDWNYVGAWTYVLLPEAGQAAQVAGRLPGFVERHVPEALRGGTTLALQPLADIHLHSRLDDEVSPGGNVAYVYVFTAIALLILLIACINFMNLATARSAGRMREVGVRKVLGAHRLVLAGQFLGEAVLLSLVAVVLAVGLAEVLRPLFEHLVGLPLGLDYAAHPEALLAWLGLGLAVGVVAGSYPAFYLSSFTAARVLKGTPGAARGGVALRRALVVGQFAVSIILLIGIGVIARQVEFMKNQDLGFDEEEILFVRSRPGVNFQAFKQALARHPDVLQVIGGGSVPGSGNAAPITFQMFRSSSADADQRLQMASTFVDADYDDLFGLRLAEGRFFDPAFTDDRSVVVNRAAVQSFGWTDGPVGKEVEMFDMLGNSAGLFEVVGVVEDYHYESLHNRIQPIVLFTNGATGGYGNYILRIRTADLAATTAFIEARWKEATSAYPLAYFFLDQDLDGLYRQEEQLSRIIGYFTLLAVVIAALGLFGLASYTAEQRTKEIGVRKVLGASVPSIVALLARDFVGLVGVAFVVAVPVAYLAMSRWMDGFAYQAGLSPGIFVLAGVAAAGVALATVSYQALKAGLADPVASLRYE